MWADLWAMAGLGPSPFSWGTSSWRYARPRAVVSAMWHSSDQLIMFPFRKPDSEPCRDNHQEIDPTPPGVSDPPSAPLPHPLVELCDEPQLGLGVAPSFLCGDEPQDVLVPHARRHEHVPLGLPGVLILQGGGGEEGLGVRTAALMLGANTGTCMGKIFTAMCSFII